jgi:putative membrane protein
MSENTTPAPVDSARVLGLTRPHPNLLWQYLILSALSLPAFPVLAVVLYFRYHTLRYRFDDHGVSVSYGILFRREAFLTYARIQDIHVRRNVVERWLGLGTVEVETAGSGAGAESLPGLRDFELVRDFLYERMRGGVARPSEDGALNGNESVKVLREIRDALREARAAIQQEPKR